MTAIQKKAYRDALNSQDAVSVRENLAGGKKIQYANVFALLTRLKQICNHPSLAAITAGEATVGIVDPTETGKWEALDEIISEALDSNLKIVIFTQYLGMIDMI